jgi:NADPH:quinone reductase-like Zn-dependent oxidoreductase
MKASFLASYGGPEVIKYGDLPDPEINNNQILVEVKAVSVNPVDYKIKSGALKLITGSKFPKIIGTDYSGIVKSIGSDVTGFKKGDKVYGATPVLFGKPGSLAEYLCTNSKNARLMPEGMSFEDAASIPVAGLTALNGLRKCHVTSGTNVLINGAAGGVGHFAIQIAKAYGAIVTATCSKANTDLVRKLGADEIYGYSAEQIAAIDKKFDAIFDAYGKMKYKDIRRLLRKNGIYASPLFFGLSYISAFLVKLVFRKTLTSSNIRKFPEDFDVIEKLYREKKLKPLIESTFTLESAAEAFEFAEKGRPRGKVIIRI